MNVPQATRTYQSTYPQHVEWQYAVYRDYVAWRPFKLQVEQGLGQILWEMHSWEDPSWNKTNQDRIIKRGGGSEEKREVAFLEYLYTACVTTTVSPSAFMETSLCTFYVVSLLF